MKRLFDHVSIGVLLLIFSTCFLACHKTDNSVDNNAPVSGLMAFNLATDKAVSVTLSGNPITNYPLAFNSYTGSYLNIYSGNRLVQSYDFNTNNVLDSSSFNFQPQNFYSLFVVGTNGQYRNVIAHDVYDSLNSSMAYVRYINAINGASSPTVTISSNGTNVVNANASFASVSNFAAVTPGSVTIQVSNGGNINKSRTISLDQQQAYTVLLTGTPGSAANDSLQIKFIANGIFSENAHKASSANSSAATN